MQLSIKKNDFKAFFKHDKMQNWTNDVKKYLLHDKDLKTGLYGRIAVKKNLKQNKIKRLQWTKTLQ